MPDAKPLQLVPKPTAAATKRQEAVEFLKARLKEAEAGEIDEVCVMVRLSDGRWRYNYTAVESTTEWIGRLEIMKVAMMDRNRDESHE